MLDALRVLWAALVGLYDESLVLIRGNLFWLVLSIPLYAVLAAVLLPVAAMESGAPTVWPFVLAALLVVVLPSPGAIGVGALGDVIARRESPPFDVCSGAIRRWWRRGLGLFAIGAVAFGVLAGNVVFYASVAPGVVRFVAIVWLYGLLFWLAMQLYVVPLLLRLPGASLRDVYWRAAVLTLGHPLFSITLALALLVLAALSLLALPAFVLLAGSFAALAQAQAFRLLRQRHGDLPESEREGTP